MKLHLIYQGSATDDNSFFRFETTVEVDDETAEFAGRDFARLVHLAERGIVEGQRVAYQIAEDET